MVIYKTKEDIEFIRESCLLVSKTLALVAQNISVGTKLNDLDTLAENFILSFGAKPAFKGYHGFPSTLCMSLNDVVVHGIPSEYTLKSTDIISVDCGVLMNGFYGDAAYTFALNDVNIETQKLLTVTKQSLYLAIQNLNLNSRIGDIGFAVQSYCESYGYSIVRDLVGHGLGTSLHEDPQVPNYGKRGTGLKIKPGLVIAIEPMVNAGSKSVKMDEDGWTIRTIDSSMSAHFEHTIAITENGVDTLSNHEIIVDAIKSNDYLLNI